MLKGAKKEGKNKSLYSLSNRELNDHVFQLLFPVLFQPLNAYHFRGGGDIEMGIVATAAESDTAIAESATAIVDFHTRSFSCHVRHSSCPARRSGPRYETSRSNHRLRRPLCSNLIFQVKIFVTV